MYAGERYSDVLEETQAKRSTTCSPWRSTMRKRVSREMGRAWPWEAGTRVFVRWRFVQKDVGEGIVSLSIAVVALLS